MDSQYDERVLDNWRLANKEGLVKFKKDDGEECDSDLKNTMPAHLASFVLSNSK